MSGADRAIASRLFQWNPDRPPVRGHLALLLLIVAGWTLVATGQFLVGNRIIGGAQLALAVYWWGLSMTRSRLSDTPPLMQAVTLVINVVSELVIVGAAAWCALENQDLPGPLAVGFLAAAGA